MFATEIIPRYYPDQGMNFGSFLIVFSALLFFLLLNRILRKKPIYFIPKKNQSLGNYTFSFDSTNTKTIDLNQPKKLSLISKFFLYSMMGILIITPFDTFIWTIGDHFSFSWIWDFST